MTFEWDINKDTINIEKHHISFEQAKEIFIDPLHLSIIDKRYNYNEERWITIGLTRDKKLLTVAHLYFFNDKNEEIIRIISARTTTVKERRQYET